MQICNVTKLECCNCCPCCEHRKQEEIYGIYYGDKKASESLKNNSVCVYVDSGIRNIYSEDDLYKPLVYINNCTQFKNQPLNFTIEKGEYVRYKLVKIS